jgi:hypothetical protein
MSKKIKVGLILLPFVLLLWWTIEGSPEYEQLIMPFNHSSTVLVPLCRKGLVVPFKKGIFNTLPVVHRVWKSIEDFPISQSNWTKMGFSVRDTDHIGSRQDMIDLSLVDIYDQLPSAVLKADFWRYAIIHACGGLYADADIKPLQPIVAFLSEYTPSDDLMAFHQACGNRYVQKFKTFFRLHGLKRAPQFGNGLFFAPPCNPVLAASLLKITMQTKNGVYKDRNVRDSILEWTGPALFTDMILTFHTDKMVLVSCAKGKRLYHHLGLGTWKK